MINTLVIKPYQSAPVSETWIRAFSSGTSFMIEEFDLGFPPLFPIQVRIIPPGQSSASPTLYVRSSHVYHIPFDGIEYRPPLYTEWDAAQRVDYPNARFLLHIATGDDKLEVSPRRLAPGLSPIYANSKAGPAPTSGTSSFKALGPIIPASSFDTIVIATENEFKISGDSGCTVAIGCQFLDGQNNVVREIYADFVSIDNITTMPSLTVSRIEGSPFLRVRPVINLTYAGTGTAAFGATFVLLGS